MAKVGRPKDRPNKKLQPGWQQVMLDLAAEGASELEVRTTIGISADLWYRWVEEEPEFSATVKDCKALCEMWWERQGRKLSTGAKGNAVVWIFNMKNRFGWRDKQEVEHSGRVEYADLTDEEIDLKIRQLKASDEG
ncbi:hypothetical protein D3C86_1602520 [compost metagenome]